MRHQMRTSNEDTNEDHEARHPTCEEDLGIPSPVRVTRSQSTRLWALDYSLQDLRKKQLGDIDIGPVLRLRWFELGKRPFGQEVCSTSAATRHYWLCWDSLIMQDGLLLRRFCSKDGTGEFTQFIVPKSMKSNTDTDFTGLGSVKT